MKQPSPRPQPGGAPESAPAPDPASSAETEIALPSASADASLRDLATTRVMDASALATPHDAAAVPSAPVRQPRLLGGPNLVALGDYKIVKKLGEGAMGAVYKATQISFERDVALKVLFPHIASNPKLVERLHREGRAMGQLDHPNIVQAYAVGEDQGCHFVAMEFVDGASTQKWVTQLGRLSVADSVRIILDCARGLAYAHAQGIVHRDIKPDNILLDAKGKAKIADLGMVKSFDEDMSLTQTGHAVGTPWYMPMEQAKNAKDTDGRSDIYALGCTLYCFLTGQPPFAGKTLIDVIQAKGQGTFPPARKTNPDVPERLDLVMVKMIAKLPQYRYQNCEELIRDLEGLQLAGEALSFLAPAAVGAPSSSLAATAGPSPSDVGVTMTEPETDPDVWYVRLKAPTGEFKIKKYRTSQILKMVGEGTLDHKAKASHHAVDGFRALATYKEFQGSALSKASKAGTDKKSVQYRNLYKKIEEKDRRREESASADDKSDLRRYWLELALKVGGVVVGIGLLAAFLYWVGTRLGG